MRPAAAATGSEEAAIADATKEFFESIGRKGREPLFGAAIGTVQFELADGTHIERWLVSVNKGDVTVSPKRGKADCTVRVSKKLFEDVARGEVNAMAAILRGELTVEGDSTLLVRFQRLFPSPPPVADEARRS
jgi:putative sterol carrier protein